MTGTERRSALGRALATGQPEVALGTITGEVAGQQYGEARDQTLTRQALPYAGSRRPYSWPPKITRRDAVQEPERRVAAVQDLLTDDRARGSLSGRRGFPVEVNEWANLNPDKSFSDLMAEQPSAMLDTLLQTVVATGAIQV
jgi:hypothetical protein